MSQRDAIQKAINQELLSAGIPASVDMEQLEIPEDLKVIAENPPQTLSEVLIEHSCPLIQPLPSWLTTPDPRLSRRSLIPLN